MPEFDNMDKNLVAIVVEKTLLNMGLADLQKVESMLRSEHNCKLDDCLEHPEILRDVLCELYGNCYEDIFKSIIETLSHATMNTHIENFIKELKQ